MNTTSLQHSVGSSCRNYSRHTAQRHTSQTRRELLHRDVCSKHRQVLAPGIKPSSSSSSRSSDTTKDDSSSSSSRSGHTTTDNSSSASARDSITTTTTTTPAPAGSAGLCVGLPPPCDLGGALPQSRWNAVSLAYLGDAVWEGYLRTYFYSHGGLAWQPEQQHSRVKSKANTHAQATCYRLLLSEGWPTGAESDLMRWAANSSSVAPPKHATRQQYKQATALEALVAHLYLTDGARLQELMAWVLEPSQVGQWRSAVPGQQQARPNSSSSQQGATPGPSKQQQGARRRLGQQH